jgi:single-stranded-DNA-specific exonuclease
VTDQVPDKESRRVMARKRWQVRPVDESAAARLGTAMGLFPSTARVLVARGLDTIETAERFLNPGLDELHSPFEFMRMEVAVGRLLAAIHAEETIAVHGDYDVDGITGSVLLATVLRHLGAQVEIILPHRLTDGYGLNPSGIERAAAAGASVLVAVDCGITALEACAHAAKLGIDVIIADHHLPQEQLPEAVAILNPRLPDSGYPEADLAAVAVAFKLASALLERSGSKASGLAMLKLVALGTIADLVPLRGENRALAVHGLAGLATAVNPGLRALMEVAGVDPRRVTAGDVGFRLAPRINAAGRVGHPDYAAEMFMTNDQAVARELAGKLERLNQERREIEQKVSAAALEAHGDDPGAIVVAAGQGWHRGVIGIVASRLVEHTARPALVVSIEDGEAHGSARSVPGFDISAALAAAAPVLDSYGGHKQAAGFRLRADRVDELRVMLNDYASRFDADSLRAVLTCDDELHADAVTTDLALELERLAPFGIGNPRPRFLCEGLRLVGPPLVLKEQHLKLRVRSGDDVISALAWRRAELAEPLAGVDRVDVVATLKSNRFRGRVEPQLEIDDLRA